MLINVEFMQNQFQFWFRFFHQMLAINKTHLLHTYYSITYKMYTTLYIIFIVF